MGAKMKDKSLVVGLLVACLLFFPKFSFGEDGMLASATRGWKRLEDAGRNLTYLFEVTRDDGIGHNPANNDYSVWRTEASYKGNNVLFRTYFDKGDGTELHFFTCRNDEYAFRIVRTDQNSSWRMDDLVEQVDHDVPFDTEDMDYLLAPWSILKIPLNTIVSDPSFRLVAVTSERDGNNNELSLISFELMSANSKFELMTQLRQCRVLLNPKHDYAVVSFEAEFENKNGNGRFRGKGKCTYDFSVDPPVLKFYDYTLLRGGGAREITWSVKFLKVEPCILDQKDFRLPAYGFSEPNEPTKRFGVVQIVSMVIGVLLIIIGLYLRWLKSRR
jgi:hypothetical protein